MDLDPGEEEPHQKVLSRLCNTVEVMVSEREAALAVRCAKDGFLEEPFKRALEREQEVMEECRRMKGFRFKSISREAFVGSADGCPFSLPNPTSTPVISSQSNRVCTIDHGSTNCAQNTAITRLVSTA